MILRALLSRLFPPSNPLMACPEYVSLERRIAERRRKHQPVRDLQAEKQALVHRALRYRRAG